MHRGKKTSPYGIGDPEVERNHGFGDPEVGRARNLKGGPAAKLEHDFFNFSAKGEFARAPHGTLIQQNRGGFLIILIIRRDIILLI